MNLLSSIDEIKEFFKQNTTPIYYVAPNSFNLMGIEKWVSNFRFIAYEDSFDGQLESLFVPKKLRPKTEFKDTPQITNYLLSHPEVIDFINQNGKPDDNGKVVFLLFDERTKSLAEKLNLEVYCPSASLISYLNNKSHLGDIAEKAEVACVPNILAKLNSYMHLKPLAGSLGDDLVIQTPYGHSGENTFFISNEADYKKYADTIEKEKYVKIMKRLDSYGAAIEACVTKSGVVLSPVFKRLVGIGELTPNQAGWCGNTLTPNTFSKQVTDKIKEYTTKFGNHILEQGYRGSFQLDFMIDKEDQDEIYLGEFNPLLTAISSLTNNLYFANNRIPIFLFHLLEWMDIPFNIDIEELNSNWSTENLEESWSILSVKHVVDTCEKVTDTCYSGIWKMKMDCNIAYNYFECLSQVVLKDKEVFFVNSVRNGDEISLGTDLGYLIIKGEVAKADAELNKKTIKWLNAIRSQYRSEIISFTEDQKEIDKNNIPYFLRPS